MTNMNKRLFVGLTILVVVTALVFGGLVLLSISPPAGRATVQAHPIPVVSHNLMPIASNQWYSNIYAQFPTEPLYTLPAAFQLSPQGVGVSLPNVTKTANTI